MSKNRLYMAVTNDEYELPIIVTDTMTEMARIMGKQRTSISKSMSRHGDANYRPSGRVRYVMVEMNDVD